MKEKNKKPVIFIITTTYQALVVWLIIRQMRPTESTKFFFAGPAAELYLDYEKQRIWNRYGEVVICNSYISAFIKASLTRRDALFIDADTGLRRYILLFLGSFISKNACVYQEGRGTYKRSVYASGIKKNIFDLIGIATHMGGSRFVRCVYVTKPQLYKKINPESDAQVKTVHWPTLEEFSSREICETFLTRKTREFFLFLKEQKRLVVIMSNWLDIPSCPFDVEDSMDMVLIKPHPHFSGNCNERGLNLWLGREDLAEAVIALAATRVSESVTVFHQNSTIGLHRFNEKICYKNCSVKTDTVNYLKYNTSEHHFFETDDAPH